MTVDQERGASSRPVVVGVDPSPLARTALDWAAAEADRRSSALLVAHAFNTADYELTSAAMTGGAAEVAHSFHEAARQLLADSADRVREQYPRLELRTEMLSEDAVAGLLELADGAGLLVVGTRGQNRFLTALLGSVSQGLVTHARVPTVVVRPEGEPLGPVVLGLADQAADELVEFAFREAALRRCGLHVLRCLPPGSARSGGGADPLAAARSSVERLLAGARTAHPEVLVDIGVDEGMPEEALVQASHSASLLVVGAHRRRRRFSLPLGRVAFRVLHGAACPVAVVHGRAGAAQDEG